MTRVRTLTVDVCRTQCLIESQLDGVPPNLNVGCREREFVPAPLPSHDPLVNRLTVEKDLDSLWDVTRAQSGCFGLQRDWTLCRTIKAKSSSPTQHPEPMFARKGGCGLLPPVAKQLKRFSVGEKDDVSTHALFHDRNQVG